MSARRKRASLPIVKYSIQKLFSLFPVPLYGKSLCCWAVSKEALIKSARAGGRRFWFSRKFQNWRNTLCISQFGNCTDGAKEQPASRRRFIQRFLNKFAPSKVFLAITVKTG